MNSVKICEVLWKNVKFIRQNYLKGIPAENLLHLWTVLQFPTCF
jgi:hypothetical protein